MAGPVRYKYDAEGNRIYDAEGNRVVDSTPELTIAKPEWGSAKQLVNDPKEFWGGVANIPKSLYDVGRQLISIPVSAAEATLSQGGRYLGNLNSMLGTGVVNDHQTKHNAAGTDITPWIDDYTAIHAGREKGMNALLTDPLMALPLGKIAGLAREVPLVSRGLRAIAGSPAAAGRSLTEAVELGTVSGKAARAAEASRAEASLLAEQSKLVGDGLDTYGFAFNKDPYLAGKLLSKAESATEQVAKLPWETKWGAKLASSAPLGSKLAAIAMQKAMQGAAAAAPAIKGAGEMTALGSLERGLNNPEQTLSAYKPNLADPLLGAAAGQAASMLQGHGLKTYPSMEATTNRYLLPENIDLIKKNLPEILNKGWFPKDKFGVARMADAKLAKLGEPYQKGIDAISETNAAHMPYTTPDQFLVDLWDKVENHPVTRTNLPLDEARRSSLGGTLSDFVANRAPGHRNAAQLDEMLQGLLAKSENPSEFYRQLMGTNKLGKSPVESQFLSAPYNGVSVDDIRSRMEAKVEKQLLDPRSTVAKVPGVAEPEYPGMLRDEMERKLTALLTKGQAAGQLPNAISPALASDVRTGMTSPLTFKNVSENQESLQAKQLANDAFHESINDALMANPAYKKELGDNPLDYKLWRSMRTLAEHSGNTGLASRLLGFSFSPFTLPHASYKAGRALENIIPGVVAGKDIIARRVADTTSTTKAK